MWATPSNKRSSRNIINNTPLLGGGWALVRAGLGLATAWAIELKVLQSMRQ